MRSERNVGADHTALGVEVMSLDFILSLMGSVILKNHYCFF